MSSVDFFSSISFNSSISILSPISRSPPAFVSTQNPSLFFNFPLSLSAHRRRSNVSGSCFPSLEPQSSGNEEEEEEENLLEVEDSEDVDDIIDEDLELVALEEEAQKAAREYSLSLSRELKIEDETNDQKGTHGKQKRCKGTTRNIPDHLLPKVAIVGRPNVGKSALFNRLVGGNKAIVVDEPGVTRDRLYGRSFWGDYEFMVVDTGGVLTVSKLQSDVMEELAISTTIGMEGIPLASREAAVARMPSMIERQATVAVEESSVIIFLVDGQAGLTAADEEIGDWLRKNYSTKCIILAVNKCESPRKGVMQASEFWSLGFSPLPISAVSGTGTGELLDLVCSGLVKNEDSESLVEEENYVPAIAIVGRPNVGKSSILNALVGEDRTIVSPVSGTTRDAIDTEFTGPDGQKFRLIDTAGIRRRAAVASSGSTTEALSVNRAFRAVRRSDVVALVIEALACITEQDFKIAERIEREGKGCLIVVNKWDTIPNKNQETTKYYEQDVREKLRVLNWAPIVYSTAIAGRSVEKIIVAASAVEKERSRRLTTAILNQVVQEALAFKSPPRTRGGKRGRVYYCTQGAIGALDGTLVHAVVPVDQQTRYRGRGRGECYQNVLGICDFNMIFTFVWAGWEGIAHDSRVLKEVAFDTSSGFPFPPPDKYYLCDAAYINTRGFLSPYRNTRYWLADFRRRRALTKEEKFNHAHAQLRNVIERAYGVLKARFPILKRMAPYPFTVQRDIVIACFAVHNFIRKHNIEDELFAQYDRDNMFVNEAEQNEGSEEEGQDEPQWGDQGVEFMVNLREQIALQLLTTV